ncbi:hypothetical protein [Lapillicoccus sp.]|uniref:hypothetical protein n=1 Tax=Lapillicoccus sp. TaxID=1909287 RepID=UPI003263041F
MTQTTIGGGMLAVSWEWVQARPSLEGARASLGAGRHVDVIGSDWCCTIVGAEPTDRLSPATHEISVQLVKGGRVSGRDIQADDVARWLSGDEAACSAALNEVQPPFAAIHYDRSGDALRAMTDRLGLRHIYACTGDGWAALSTSSAALARLLGAGLDLEALGTISLLGWHVGQRTSFRGVRKLAPGAVATLQRGVLVEAKPANIGTRASRDLAASVGAATDIVRAGVNSFLDDHPDSFLQLTGGIDSRILLAAVPPQRRRYLTAMTLAVPGSPDAAMAADLSRREEMAHVVVDVAATSPASPEHAYQVTHTGAERLDFSADPLAWAGLHLAEASVEQRPRLSGLGGEVVRGFYYVGPAWRMTVSPRKVRWLAAWRLFPNESVPDDVLEDDFASERRRSTLERLTQTLDGLGPNWAQATDDFYLWHRMQRWAGVTTTSTCYDRLVSNPMLDVGFISVGRSVPPRWKAGSQYLSRILVELDPDLATLPLDGRPPPMSYAYPGPGSAVRQATLLGRKVVRKVAQRVASQTQAPAGGAVIADLVVQHWRQHPELLEHARRIGVVREDWLDQVLDGRTVPTASSVGFLVTLSAASDALVGPAAGSV